MPENNEEPHVSDCTHPTVTWEPQEVPLLTQIKTVHWFTCDWCPDKARVVTLDVQLTE